MSRIKCKACKTVLESKTVNDFQRCKCGVFVDGGSQYMRLGWPHGLMTEWVEIMEDTYGPTKAPKPTVVKKKSKPRRKL